MRDDDTPTFDPPPETARHGLIASLRELDEATADYLHEVGILDDPVYAPRVRAVMVPARDLLTVHLPEPNYRVVRDVEVLRRGLRQLPSIPAVDATLGMRAETRKRLRSAVGNLREALNDLRRDARAAYPGVARLTDSSRPVTAPDKEATRAALGLLDRFAVTVEAIRREAAAPRNVVIGTDTLIYYANDMTLQINLTRMHLTINDRAIDLPALVSAAESASDGSRRLRGQVEEFAGEVTDALHRNALDAFDVVGRIVTVVKELGGAVVGIENEQLPFEPEMALVPSGVFNMGIRKAETRRERMTADRAQYDDWSRPEHPSRISRPFLLGKYPVTIAEYGGFVQATGRQSPPKPAFSQTDRHPVVNVSWYDAQAYVEWLSNQTGHRYCLPSEAEWEYACRAGTSTARHWGDRFDPKLANNNHRGTTEVGSYPPNEWGLHDMLGNVWEWVADPFHATYDGAPEDGSVWERSGEPGRRVLRGGSWNEYPKFLRAGCRGTHSAENRIDDVGFRVARRL
jgi:formylglycine-generating enzyme required for sulfatase activity